MKKLPLIVYTEPPSLNYPNIVVYGENFFKMIEALKLEYLFSAMTRFKINPEFMLYFIKDGYIVRLNPRERSYLKEFDIGDFSDFAEFLEANFYEIPTSKEYNNFKSSPFLNINKLSYRDYVEATKMGFSDKKSFSHANQLGIETFEEYQRFRNAGVSYEDYKKMITGGFTDKIDYGRATQLGIETRKAYNEHIAHRFDPYLNKIKDIKKDSDDAFNKQRYGEFIRLEYLSAEKLGELVYFKLFDKQPQDQEEVNLSELIASIEKKEGRELNLIDELHKWRLKRNFAN